MTRALIWIGGTTLATMLLFGTVAIGARMLYSNADEEMAVAPTLEDAIPVDPSKFGENGAPLAETQPDDQLADADAALTEETVGGEAAAGAGEAGRAAGTATTAGDADGETVYDARDRATRAIAQSNGSGSGSSSGRMVVKRVLPISGPIKYGEWFWDTDGVPPGPIVMTVDLDARVISVFRGGYEIGAAAVLLGTQEHPTPLGTFPIRYKMRENVSEKYNNAPMPYSMFLTKDGVALHGSPVRNGYASHGCIGLPEEFAAKVFAVAKKGDKVIITRGETLKMGEPIL